MGILSRWRKRPAAYRNTLAVGAPLIRTVIEDNLQFEISGVLYDYIRTVSDDDLDWLGEQILNDPDLWLCLTDTIIAYAVSMKFTEILEEGGFDE